MFKRLLSGWFCPLPYLKILIAVLAIAPIIVMPLQSTSAEPIGAAIAPPAIKSPASATQPATEAANNAATPIDPLGSPHPVPWDWVMNTHATVTPGSGLHYYRSPSLVSPDGKYAAYSRIQMSVQPELYRSRVSSVMFVENLRTGELQAITTSSLANNWLAKGEADLLGTIFILTPIGWSQKSDYLLARQFAGLFSSSNASDFAVIWHQTQNLTSTVAPSQTAYKHDISILLGWSQIDPKRVLFRAGNLGDEQWSLWAVTGNGQTVAATDIDQPLVFGKVLNQEWSGPQVAYR